MEGRAGELAVPPLDVVKQTGLERLVWVQGGELTVKGQEGRLVDVTADLWEERLEVVPSHLTHRSGLLCATTTVLRHDSENVLTSQTRDFYTD